MRRPSRLRRIAKWAGLGICMLIAIVWVISGWWSVGYLTQTDRLFLFEGGGIGHSVFSEKQRWHKKYVVGANLYREQTDWSWQPFCYPGTRHQLAFLPYWIPFSLVIWIVMIGSYHNGSDCSQSIVAIIEYRTPTIISRAPIVVIAEALADLNRWLTSPLSAYPHRLRR